MQHLLALLRRLHLLAIRVVERPVFTLTHEGLHLVYFGFVFLEGHGTYPLAAGILFVLGLIQLFDEGGA